MTMRHTEEEEKFSMIFLDLRAQSPLLKEV